MSDIDMSDPPSRPMSPLPEASHDPTDPNDPMNEDKDTPTPPVANSTQDMDDVEDDESVLSEVDEAQFEDFDPANVAIEHERPALVVDEDTVKLLGRHRKKRAEGEEGEKQKKPKERRREKKQKKRREDDEENFSGGEEVEGKRKRKARDVEKKGKPKKRQVTPENEDALDPEERRRRALDRAMDEALRNPNKRRARKQDGIDLDSFDAEIEDVRRRMTEAAQADTIARSSKPPKPAMHKLKMLPEVVALLNKNTHVDQLVDPETNLLEAVRFFLEPLDDGSLPAYNIQRDLFSALAKLPITKETLVASGIGKVTLFYTKSKRPELGIKRQAERLLGEWTRPILKRSDDYRKRRMVQANYDPSQLPLRTSSQLPTQETAAEARERALAPPVKSNRARIQGGPTSYNIVPVVTAIQESQFARPMGARGEDTLRRLKAKQQSKSGGGARR
ncbi:MAG: Transcription factor iws1 [Cirrosporium novae-zelandiae]|nr:MAG: Transcription factor iws1 [Cirrosporium novae-zelandiae]